MQTASRRSGESFAGFTIEEFAVNDFAIVGLASGDPATESPRDEFAVDPRLAMGSSPKPWQRWHVIPPWRKGLSGNFLSVPAAGGCIPLVWQFRQST